MRRIIYWVYLSKIGCCAIFKQSGIPPWLEGLPFRDGSHLAGYIVVNDKEAIDLVDSGIDQTSLGHKSTVVRVHGKEWDAEKTKIRANHVAIVRTGRARTTRISDSEDASINELEAKIDSLTSKLEKEQVMLVDAPGRDLTAFVWLLWIKNTQIKDKK